MSSPGWACDRVPNWPGLSTASQASTSDVADGAIRMPARTAKCFSGAGPRRDLAELAGPQILGEMLDIARARNGQHVRPAAQRPGDPHLRRRDAVLPGDPAHRVVPGQSAPLAP